MKQSKPFLATRALAYCALLAAISVILARLLIPMPNASTRFSIEAVPIFLSGMLFGPVAGGMVGFVADFVGCLFSPYGYNPIFSVPPILYGVFAGLLRCYLSHGVTIPRLVISFLPPVILGSILYQSATLAYMYYDGVFFQGFVFYLSTRTVQFAITLALDVLVIYLLFRARLFTRLGIWPPAKCAKSPERKDDV